MTSSYDPARDPRQQPRGAAPQQQAPRSTVQWAQDAISGCCPTAEEARKRIATAHGRCHIIGGSSSFVVPLGHEVMLTVVPIILAETYQTSKPKQPKEGESPVEERRGIGKATLMAVAAAAGVQWTSSYRLPPMGDSLYVRWKAIGAYRDLAGVWRQIEGDRDSDFRNGSPQIEGKTPGDVAGLRSNIMRSTSTKAKLRAIREAFAIPASMTRSELDKPFVVARLVLTGNVADREDRATFIRALVEQSSASVSMLYGIAPQSTLALPGPQGAPRHALGPGSGYGAPMLTQGAVIDPAGEGDAGNPEAAEAGGDMPPPPPPAPPPVDLSAPIDWRAVKSAGNWTAPFGKNKGAKLSDMDGHDVAWWRKTFEGDLANPEKQQYRASALSRLKAIYERQHQEGEITPLDAPPPEPSQQGEPRDPADDDGRGPV